MMRFMSVVVVVVSTFFPVANAASDADGAKARSQEASRLEEKAKQTYCEYRYFNKKNFHCTDLPPAEAKIQCEKQAKETHKEKLECWCTNDPATTKALCKKGKKGGQKWLSVPF